MTPRGAMTRSLPAGGGFSAPSSISSTGRSTSTCDSGSRASLPVAGKPIAEVHRELTRAARPSWAFRRRSKAGRTRCPIRCRSPTTGAERAWDADAARRLHGAFLQADRNFNAFRALYRGKSSPSQLFWGSFDLAVTRFSGRHGAGASRGGAAPARRRDARGLQPRGDQRGVLAGGGRRRRGGVLCLRLSDAGGRWPSGRSAPEAAGWNAALGEFVLPYAAVRAAGDPDAAVQDFLQRDVRGGGGAARLAGGCW